MANVVAIKPEMISWAVDRSGMPLSDFPADVSEWIRKEKQTTFVKLEAFAKNDDENGYGTRSVPATMKVFDSVLVISDRNVIDGQLQDAVRDFERTTGEG